MPDSLSLVRGHSVHFPKFPILQILKLLMFIQFHPNFIQRTLIIEQYRLFPFWRFAPNYKNYGISKFFLIQDHVQLEISKSYFSHNFHWSPSKLYENVGYHGKSKFLIRILQSEVGI